MKNIIIFFNKCIIFFLIFFLFDKFIYAHADTEKYHKLTSTMISLQESKEYGEKKYGIKIIFNNSLKNEKVPLCSEASTSSEKWISYAFDRFNKITYHDKKGKVESIKILSLKDSDKSRQEPLPTPSELESDSINSHEDSSELTPNRHAGAINSNQHEVPPEGVTIIHEPEAASLPPDGVEITDPETQETELPPGVEVFK